MQTTTNYGLKKPDGTDPVKRSDFNTNFDIIDNVFKDHGDKITNVSGSVILYAVAAGVANTYTVTLSPAPISYTDGMRITVKINVASTGASTLNVNSLGAKAIKDSLGNAITAGGLKANTPYTMCYESASDSFILLGKGGGGTATASHILSGYTATTDAGSITGTIASKAAATITPGTTNQTIAAGQYLSGVQTIAGDADLISANIKAGANIFGVAGSSTVVDTSPGTVTAAQMLSGAVGFSDGVQVTGTITSKAAATYTPGTTNQTIAAGQYLSGTQTIAGDADLISANIISNKTIFGVAGSASIASLGGATYLFTTLPSIGNIYGNAPYTFNLPFTPKAIVGNWTYNSYTDGTVNWTDSATFNGVTVGYFMRGATSYGHISVSGNVVTITPGGTNISLAVPKIVCIVW